MGFTELLPVQAKRPRAIVRQVSQLAGLSYVVRGSLSVSTWLLLGGLLQGTLLLLVPYWWTLAPTLVILAFRFSTTLLISLHLLPNPYLKGSIHEWTSAQIPDPKTGQFSSTPADQQVAVLHLGAKYNHPLGVFSPHAPKLNEFADKMYKVLDQNKPNNGYLGGQPYMTYDEAGCLEYSELRPSIPTFSGPPSHPSISTPKS